MKTSTIQELATNDHAVLNGTTHPAVQEEADQARHAARRAEQRKENVRLQESPPSSLAPNMTAQDMEKDCVWIASGSVVGRISEPHFVLPFREFADFTAASASLEIGRDGRQRKVKHADKWRDSTLRLTVFTRTFHAGEPVICKSPDGQTALNTWRAIERTPALSDITMFLEQVCYLFPEASERERFLDWLAHLEQRPGELPHYGWLHIADETGTGRNWLASLFSRLWRGYVAPSVSLKAIFDSQFNGMLGGRVLAVVDEAQSGGGPNAGQNTNTLRSVVTEEERNVNPKYGRQYKEFNACRWLVFSNHSNALPIDDKDRRFWVVRLSGAPRVPEVYSALYAALKDPEFVNAVGVFLRDRDISNFNSGERPPMTAAKRTAVMASKPLIQRDTEHLVRNWPADVITNSDIADALSGDEESKVTSTMREHLEKLGARRLTKTMYIAGRTERGWILRNCDRWDSAAPAKLAAEAGRARFGASPKATVFELMERSATTPLF